MSAQKTHAPSEQAPGLAVAIRFHRDLYLYWSAVDRAGGVALTSRGYVPRPTLRRLREDLAVGEPIAGEAESGDVAEADAPRLFFLRRTLERLSLLRVRGEGEHQRLEAAEIRMVARYLARPLAERTRMALRLWMGGAWWPDRLDPRAGLPGLLMPAAPRVAIARRRLIEEIAFLAPGALLPAPPTARPLRATPTHGLRASHHRPPPRSPARSTAPGDDVTPAALAGPLAWLGVVVWDESAGEWRAGLPGDALHDVHAGAESSAELAERSGRVAAQSDLSIIAYPPFSGPELLTLDLCGDRETLSQTARYRLSRAAFARARDFGWDAAEVARRLERLIGATPPDALRVTLSDWERLASRLHLEANVTLLEMPSAETLDALLADRLSAGWNIRRLTPTAAIIAPEAAPRVRAWLLRHGLLPAMDDAQSGG